MKTHSRNSKAEQAGRWLGRAWRAIARQEAHLIRWMTNNGISLPAARGSLWALKLVILTIALYAFFWLALLLVFAFVAVKAAHHVDQDSERTKWDLDAHPDHKQRLSYDPIGYDDDPDPRFDDK